MSDQQPSGPALLIQLELNKALWGQVWLEVPAQIGSASFSVPLFPGGGLPSYALRASLLGDVQAVSVQEWRGELVLRADWGRQGARLEVHSAHGLCVPISRLGDLKPPTRDDGAATVFAWLLRVQAAGGASLPRPVTLCELRPGGDAVAFSEHSLAFRSIVDLRWPASWASELAAEMPLPSELPPARFSRDSMKVSYRLREAMLDQSGARASLKSLQDWAAAGDWFLFSPNYGRYDDWLLPIDEVTALHPSGEYCLSPQDVRDLEADPNFLSCHARVARYLLLSWGWDTEAQAPLEQPDAPGGQGWRASGAFAWRLRQLCLSLWLLGQRPLLLKVREFVDALGPLAPLGEDGFGEAFFTFGQAGAQIFWESRPSPKCSALMGPAHQGRTLRDIFAFGDTARLGIPAVIGNTS